MCFDRVVKVYKRPQKATITGYKIFELSEDHEGLGFEHKYNGKPNVQRGEWEKAVNVGKMISDHHHLMTDYPVGFHVFLTKAAALLWCGHVEPSQLTHELALVQVKARGILATGIQNQYGKPRTKADCITCEEIFIAKKDYDAAYKRVHNFYLENVDDEDEDEEFY